MAAKYRLITNWDEVPLVFDLAYASNLIQISYDILSRWHKAGKFPAVKLNGEIRVTKDAMQDFLKVKDVTS